MGVSNAGKKWSRRFNRREGLESPKCDRPVNHFGRDVGDVFKNGKWWVAEHDSGTDARRTLGRFKNRGRAQRALLLAAQARFDASDEGKAIYKRRDEALAKFGERIQELSKARPVFVSHRRIMAEATLDGPSYDQLEVRVLARKTPEEREAMRQRMASANYGSIVEAHGEAKGTLRTYDPKNVRLFWHGQEITGVTPGEAIAFGPPKVQGRGDFKVKKGRGGR